jgi:hypothetical protein
MPGEGISTERMLPQEHQTNAAPPGIVPTLGRLTAAQTMFSLPCTTVGLTGTTVGQLRASWFRTGT